MMPQPSYADMLAVTDDFNAILDGFQRALNRGLQVSGGEVLYSDVDENTGDILVAVSFDAGRVRTYRLAFTEETA